MRLLAIMILSGKPMSHKTQALSVSIIIPVFNEEDYIGPCLDAIKAQSVKPLEVIIVDNNCTDATISIAKQYPFVRVVKEPIQGRTVSRNRGFNAARGDILGRIDADSIIMKDWVKRVQANFTDPSVGGVTGPGLTRTIVGIKIYSTIWSRLYFMTVQSLHGIISTWGANMAVRKTAWQEIKGITAPNGSRVHEDQDVAYALAGGGFRVVQDNKLTIRTPGGSLLYWPKYSSYVIKTFRMKRYHDRKGTLRQHRELCLGWPRRIAQGIIGWSATALFTIYSLLCWPLFIVLGHVSREKLKAER